MKLSPCLIASDADLAAARLAEFATQALVDEARLSPKPGLVDARGSGAHQDLTLALMERSAHSLTPVFHRLAIAGWQRPADSALRQEVGRIGREGEQRMMAATAGVNTHRGAIWAMGLLVTAVAMQGERNTIQQLRISRPVGAVAGSRQPEGVQQRLASHSTLPGTRRAGRGPARFSARHATGVAAAVA